MNFLAGIAVDRLLEKLTPLLNDLLAKLGQQLIEKIVAALPVIIAAVVKAVFDRVPSLPNLPDVAKVAQDGITALIDSDPDAPFGLSNIVDLSEIVRKYWQH